MASYPLAARSASSLWVRSGRRGAGAGGVFKGDGGWSGAKGGGDLGAGAVLVGGAGTCGGRAKRARRLRALARAKEGATKT